MYSISNNQKKMTNWIVCMCLSAYDGEWNILI